MAEEKNMEKFGHSEIGLYSLKDQALQAKDRNELGHFSLSGNTF